MTDRRHFPRPSTDWFRIIVDLERIMSIRQIGDAINAPPTNVWNIKNGTEPRHDVGEALKALHKARIPT